MDMGIHIDVKINPENCLGGLKIISRGITIGDTQSHKCVVKLIKE